MILKKLVTKASIILMLTSCSSAVNKDKNLIARDSMASSGPELRGIRFKSKRPTETDSLFEAAEDPETAKAVLSRDVETINRFYSGFVFRVVGNTDDKECLSEQLCLALSERRARLLNNWLISNGVPSRNLKEPIGYGQSRPIQDNASAEGRRVNRNAFIDLEEK